MILENWMVRNLENFGNCLISGKFYHKHGDLKIVETVKSLGYEEAYVLEIIHKHQPANKPGRPKITKTYIIETNRKTHTEEIKMKAKFNIGDKVEIINGTQKGKIGTVESVEKNDNLEFTYGLHVPSLKSLVGVIYKQEKDLKLEKKASKKVGRPKKVVNEPVKEEPKPKKEETIEQLNEVTKEACDLNDTQLEPAAVVDEVVETVDKTVDKVVEESKRAYDQLLEAYDVMRRSLNVNELELFSDIVMKDVEASKYVLEQMYQMSIEQLIQIRKEFA